MDFRQLDERSMAMLAGALLSLLFSYVPGLSSRYDGLDPTRKRLVMALCLLLVGIAYFAAGCFSLLPESYDARCDASGALAIVRVWLYALAGNQSTYLISARTTQQPLAIAPADGAKG